MQSTSEKTEFDKWDNKHAYFKPRDGARVSLYSDSHHDPGAPPPPPLALPAPRPVRTCGGHSLRRPRPPVESVWL